ncbi:MAG: hypothetical protein C4291_15570 [Candidatus Dadabacteria bacterium]
MLKQLKAKYAGQCSACGGAIEIGDEIYWDTATRKAKHVRCPQVTRQGTLKEPTPREGAPTRTNRKPGECELCGISLNPGEGFLYRCGGEDACLVHFDDPYGGWHLICADEESCRVRRDEKRRLEEEKRRLVREIEESFVTPICVGELEGEVIAEVVPAGDEKRAMKWIKRGDTLAIVFWAIKEGEGWVRAHRISKASLELIARAAQVGALHVVHPGLVAN